MRPSLTDTSNGRSQATDHVAFAELTDTIADASCNVGNGIASALGDAAHG
jgi:hypothetical protein